MPGWFPAAPHTTHTFDRLISEADGRGLFGCSFQFSGDRPRCGATEVRGIHERSPFAIAHAARAVRKAERRRDRASQGGA